MSKLFSFTTDGGKYVFNPKSCVADLIRCGHMTKQQGSGLANGLDHFNADNVETVVVSRVGKLSFTVQVVNKKAMGYNFTVSRMGKSSLITVIE